MRASAPEDSASGFFRILFSRAVTSLESTRLYPLRNWSCGCHTHSSGLGNHPPPPNLTHRSGGLALAPTRSGRPAPPAELPLVYPELRGATRHSLPLLRYNQP